MEPVSQQLRRARPLWATALLICIGLPGFMTLGQVAIHQFAGTPHQSGGLPISLCFAALTASYSWYAMRCGAMLGGTEATTYGMISSRCRGFRWTFFYSPHVI